MSFSGGPGNSADLATSSSGVRCDSIWAAMSRNAPRQREHLRGGLTGPSTTGSSWSHSELTQTDLTHTLEWVGPLMTARDHQLIPSALFFAVAVWVFVSERRRRALYPAPQSRCRRRPQMKVATPRSRDTWVKGAALSADQGLVVDGSRSSCVAAEDNRAAPMAEIGRSEGSIEKRPGRASSASRGA